VTHDLTLVALLALVRDIGTPAFPWPGYLDGIVLAARPDGLRRRHGTEFHVTGHAGAVRPAKSQPHALRSTPAVACGRGACRAALSLVA